MPNCLHGIAFAQKIPNAHLSVLNLELFNHYQNLPPFGSVNNSIAALVNLTLNLYFFP